MDGSFSYRFAAALPVPQSHSNHVQTSPSGRRLPARSAANEDPKCQTKQRVLPSRKQRAAQIAKTRQKLPLSVLCVERWNLFLHLATLTLVAQGVEFLARARHVIPVLCDARLRS